MGTFSVVHWLIVLIVLGVFVYPLVRIIRRMGFSGWWAVLAFLPILNVIGLWFLALQPWPALAKAEGAN